MQTPEIPQNAYDNIKYITPFISIGALGGVIKAINSKDFSWHELIRRAVTGAFGGALAGLYLKNTPYPIEMQFAIAGAIGTVACELIKTIQLWIAQKLGGDEIAQMAGQEQAEHTDGNSGIDVPAPEYKSDTRPENKKSGADDAAENTND